MPRQLKLYVSFINLYNFIIGYKFGNYMRSDKYFYAGVCVSVSISALAQSVFWGGGKSPNSVDDAENVPSRLDTEPAWVYRMGTHQYAIPTVDGDKIFVGTNDGGCRREGYKSNGGSILSCLDKKSGEVVWTFQSPRNFVGNKHPYYFNKWRSGFISGPVVVGNRIYIVGSRGDVLCLDRDGQINGNDGAFKDEIAYMELKGDNPSLNEKDGDVIWQFDMLKELDVSPHDSCGSTILYVDGLLYVNTSNAIGPGHIPATRPDAPTLCVLDAENGRLLAVDDQKIAGRVLHGSWSSPCYGVVGGRKLIYFGGGDGYMYAFEALRSGKIKKVQTLKLAWRADCNPPHFRERNGKKMEYSSWNNRLTTGPSEPIGTPVFLDGKVYIAIGQSPLHGEGEGCLTCFDGASGEVLWRTEELNRTLATLAISNGIIYVPDMAEKLNAFDLIDGKKLWSADLGGRVQYANARVADGKVFVGTERGRFWIFREGRTKEVLCEKKLLSPPITVVADNGMLYIPMQNRLSAYE